MEKNIISNKTLTGERVLFGAKDLYVENCVFEDGESPLKEAHDLEVVDSTFGWKYPLWYVSDVKVKNTYWREMGRAGVWYAKNVEVEDSVLDAPKNFRRCQKLVLKNVELKKAEETLWNCEDVALLDVKATGDYLAMGCKNVIVDNLELHGNYGFDGVKNIEVHNSRLYTKDAFWNCENVTVYDSLIEGEYLAWNSKNVTLVNCTISSLQGLCYVENLKLENCNLADTNLAFEYCSNIDATIVGGVKSILNPASGVIRADFIGTLTIQNDKVNSDDTEIICESIDAVTAEPDFEEN